MGLYSPILNLYSVNMTSGVKSRTIEAQVSPEELGRILRTPKATAEFRILRATKHLLATVGLGISMDAIADEAGIGRSTAFRHFPSRDDLVARALAESLGHFHDTVPATIKEDADFGTWMLSTVAALHRMQIEAGRGLWQLAAADDSELPPPLVKVNTERRRRRHETTVAIAQEAWRRSGRRGKVPRRVELMFALAFSSFAAHSLNFDYGAEEDESVHALAELLTGFLEGSV